MIALHLFNLLFLRYPTTKRGFWRTFVSGWLVVIAIVALGAAIQKAKKRGPYFGIAGSWCGQVGTYYLTN